MYTILQYFMHNYQQFFVLPSVPEVVECVTDPLPDCSAIVSVLRPVFTVHNDKLVESWSCHDGTIEKRNLL